MLKFSFNAPVFAKTYIGRKISRVISDFCDGLGDEKITFTVANDKLITDYMPLQTRYNLKAKVKPYMDIVAKFTIDDIISWIPPHHRALVEAMPDGDKWLVRQATVIREFLLSP